MTVTNQAAIGLNWDPQFLDLTSFVTAAGYASASVLYNSMTRLSFAISTQLVNSSCHSGSLPTGLSQREQAQSRVSLAVGPLTLT